MTAKAARVLLVDDNQALLDRAAATLSGGCEIVGTAMDGPAALAAAERLSPDVIVLDISLPGMSGFEVADRLRLRGSTAAIVFLTMDDDQEVVKASHAVGGSGYVMKTWLPWDLPHAVAEARAGRRFVSKSATVQRPVHQVKPIDPDTVTAAYEHDRTRIARQLHDDIGQRLALLTMDLDLLKQGFPLSQSELQARLGDLADRSLALAKDVQAMSHDLHSSKLEYLGLAPAAEAFCREASAETGVAVRFHHDRVPDHLSRDAALALFRVLQAAVQNAVDHAAVDEVRVTLSAGAGSITLEVSDAGAGFDPAQPRRGVGFVTMHERVRIARGALAIESRPGAGTTVRARVPLDDANQSLPAAG